MPYGFYELVRFMAFTGFAFLSYQHLGQEEKNTSLIYGALALLFQPFFKIALGRELWNLIDVLVAIGLMVSVFQAGSKKKNLKTNH